eukprot:CAMPEP_0172327020 /NCGR_PEP_ID=MMETSP1058-20130122/58323_1 /TAXON_ID=83371 /ORGANISM="Detonula confervacea, Strain CCMP 353" /LENGTH=335 /DNA_ID=CAMNT_0013043943 /DNA_START=229 /DNA_END=1236 /DNA_ORIENTATION=-
MLLQQKSSSCSAENSTNGSGVCALDDPASTVLPLAIQFAIFAGLIQISTNLHNDYADFVKGADTDSRVGQARATQKGWLTPYETCRGCVLCLFAALLVGVNYLIPTNNLCGVGVDDLEYDPVMIFTVISSLFNAVAYTGGPFPLGYIGLGNLSIGYSGLGDLFVFAYFGVVATVGTPYLYLTKVACFSPTTSQAQQLLYSSFLYSIPIGFLGTAIIVVNNLRDRNTDIHAGKKTMAVRFGGTFAKMEYFILVMGSYGFCIYFWLLERERYHDNDSTAKAWMALLPLLSFPMAIPQLKAVSFGVKDGQALNEHVGGTAKLQMIYCILMAVGLVASS